MTNEQARNELYKSIDAWAEKWLPDEAAPPPVPEPEPAPAPPAPQPHPGPNRYRLEMMVEGEGLERAAPCMGRLTFGHHDKLILGQNYRAGGWPGIYQVDAGNGHRPERFAEVKGPFGPHEIIADIICVGDKIHVIPESNGQGCKHHEITVNEHSRITGQAVHAYEWSHAGHDRIDWGAAWLCPRTGRLFLGYGNTQQLCEPYNPADTIYAHPEEIGKPLKGLLMEVGGPVFGNAADSYTNQLDGYPRSGVVLDDGSLLAGVIRHGAGSTEIVRVESRAWDGPMEPNAGGRRAPRKPGHVNTTGLSLGGWRWLWDPYCKGGEFNDVIFYFGHDNKPWWAHRSNPAAVRECVVRHGGGVVIPGMPGNFYGHAVHPVTKRPIIANGLGMLVFYEAFWREGQISLQEVANAGERRGEWNINGQAYKDWVYFTSGNGSTARGERSPGMVMRLAAE